MISNNVTVIGRLGRDPEIRYTQGAEPIAIDYLSIAVDNGYGDKKETEWLRATAFRKNAEFCEKYMKQGRLVAVSGHLHNNSYVNKDGQKVFSLEIIVDEIKSLESGKKYEDQPQPSPVQQPSPQTAQPAPQAEAGNGYSGGFINIPDGIDEELPFN